MSLKLNDLSLSYEGSVKRVWDLGAEVDKLWFEYTDDYSVFDWGKMPDTIANKGRSLAIMGAHFFEQLAKPELWQALPSSSHLKAFRSNWLAQRWETDLFQDLQAQGAASHYQGLVSATGQTLSATEAAGISEPIYLQVLPAEVVRPEPYTLIAQTVYYYSRKPSLAKRRLVPLEVVFRFGMPTGSSLKARLEKDPAYAQKLGLSKVPEQGEWFDRPVLEFFTKLEPKDRLLTVQEALLISGLTPDQFEEMVELSYAVALFLYDLFAQKEIELWDGKFEFLADNVGLMLADSIGPDELRLIYKGCHLSKEMIRQVYRGSKWEKAIKEAQDKAASSGQADWKGICSDQLGQNPEPLPQDFKAVVDKLYGTLTNHLVGTEIFKQHPSLPDFVTSLSGSTGRT